MKKIKCWVVKDDIFYPRGLVFDVREDALERAKDLRDNEAKAYTRVKHYTKEELEALPELD